MPAIDDDGFILWESAAINLYLAGKHKGQIYPPSLHGRAALFQRTFFVANELEPAVITMLRKRIVLPVEQRNPVLADEAERKRRRLFDILESELCRSPGCAYCTQAPRASVNNVARCTSQGNPAALEGSAVAGAR